MTGNYFKINIVGYEIIERQMIMRRSGVRGYFSRGYEGMDAE